MPSRRSVLSLCALVATCAVSGCTNRGESKSVDVRLRNEDTEKWPLTVAVERDSDELFRTEETIPANDMEDVGEVLIEDAFEGTSQDQFTVRAWLDGEPAGTFDYEITCDDDNRFSLAVEHHPYTDDKDLVEYVPRRCS